MLGDFLALNNFGRQLAEEHRKGTKRHIKFDDTACGLFLNVKLNGDEYWTRIRPQLARSSLSKAEAENDSIVGRRFTIAWKYN